MKSHRKVERSHLMTLCGKLFSQKTGVF